MESLFVIYIGGSIQGALIELHDMRFVVANKIEDTYDMLRKSWWGDPKSLHLDAWGVLNYADGYHLSLSENPSLGQDIKLYFVNLGGYDQSLFTELHKNVFVVAKNKYEAKQRALVQLEGVDSPHRDYQYEIDDVIDVDLVLSNKFIHLQKTDIPKKFEFITSYVPLSLV